MANGARFTILLTMADGFTNAPKSFDDFDAVSPFSRLPLLNWILVVTPTSIY
jgi:hypothetical protein